MRPQERIFPTGLNNSIIMIKRIIVYPSHIPLSNGSPQKGFLKEIGPKMHFLIHF